MSNHVSTYNNWETSKEALKQTSNKHASKQVVKKAKNKEASKEEWND